MKDIYIDSWATPEGFNRLFELYCKEYSTYEKAYEAAERQHESKFGKKKYASWESFKNTRNQKLRNRVKIVSK